MQHGTYDYITLEASDCTCSDCCIHIDQGSTAVSHNYPAPKADTPKQNRAQRRAKKRKRSGYTRRGRHGRGDDEGLAGVS